MYVYTGNMKPPTKEEERYMVLRTVYLPPTLDDKLRELAHSRRVSKNEVIRQFLEEGVNPNSASRHSSRSDKK
jgi:predicted transcriptional regulator